MSINYCHKCNKYFDEDFDVEHIEECKEQTMKQDIEKQVDITLRDILTIPEKEWLKKEIITLIQKSNADAVRGFVKELVNSYDCLIEKTYDSRLLGMHLLTQKTIREVGEEYLTKLQEGK